MQRGFPRLLQFVDPAREFFRFARPRAAGELHDGRLQAAADLRRVRFMFCRPGAELEVPLEVIIRQAGAAAGRGWLMA